MVARPFHFANPEGYRLTGRLEHPPGKVRGGAIFAHCFTCSKNSLAAVRVSGALAQRGFLVLRFDFTGIGESAGDFPETSFSSNVSDLVAAAEALAREGWPAQLLVGHSLGGAAALAAAAQISDCRAVATIGAPADPAHVEHLFGKKSGAIEESGRAEVELGGRRFWVGRKFLDDVREQKLQQQIRALRRPLLVLHSPVDRVVDIDHARRIYEAALHPKSFLSLDGADHLLTKSRDATYVAELLAAWASPYLLEPPESPSSGQVLVRERGAGFTQDILVGAHHLVADEPTDRGGEDQGPTPYDLLLAALGACTSMTLRMYARHKQWPLERVEVSLSHRRLHAEDCEHCETREGRLELIERDIVLAGRLDEQQRQRLLEIADRCPVHRTLMGHKEIVSLLADPQEESGSIQSQER